MLVLLLALVGKPLPFSRDALEAPAKVRKARGTFFSGDTPRLVESAAALRRSFVLTPVLRLLAAQGFHPGSSRLLARPSLWVLS